MKERERSRDKRHGKFDNSGAHHHKERLERDKPRRDGPKEK